MLILNSIVESAENRNSARISSERGNIFETSETLGNPGPILVDSPQR